MSRDPKEIAREIVERIYGFIAEDVRPGRWLPDMLTGDFAAAIEKDRAERGWQPIETAPKDGRRVLIWNERIDPTIGHFEPKSEGAPDDPGHDAGWFSLCGEVMPGFRDQPARCQPTHWMPIPSSPEIEEEARA